MASAGQAWVDVRGDFSALHRQLRQQAATGAPALRKTGAQMGGQISQGLASEFRQHGRTFQNLGSEMGRALTRGMATGIKVGAVGLGAGLLYSVKKASDFEQQMSALGSVSDASGKQMERLRKQALRAGAATKFSALEAARAQTELSKGGLRVAQIMKGGLRSALALAAAGEMDLGQAAESVVNSMKLFGLRGRDAMKIADGLATAANRTTADVSDFALALKQGGSAAKIAGLDFNDTLVVLEALAEAGIKGSDAGTSLKAFFLNITRDSPKAKEAMKDLGVEIFDQQGQLKSLPAISENLRKAFGSLTREQFLNKAGTIAGSDAIRTLYALYDAGPKKLGRLSKANSEQGTAAEVAKKKQDNLKGSLEQLGGSMETLGISVGTMMVPAIREGADELTDLGNKINGIAQRDDLSVGEKLAESFRVAKVDAEPWIEKLKTELDQADIPGHVADAISGATPQLVEAVAKAAPAAASAFAKTFAESDAWGKVALGAVIGKKLGLFEGLRGGGRGGAGGGALGDLGGKPLPVYVVNMGGGLPSPNGGPTVAPVPGSPAGKLKPFLKGAGKLVGRLAALDVAINLVDQKGNPIAAVINSAHDLTFGVLPKVDVKTGDDRAREQMAGVSRALDQVVKNRDLSGLDKIRGKIREHIADAREFEKYDIARKWQEIGRQAAGAAPGIEKAVEAERDAARISDQFARNLKGLRLKGTQDFDGLVKSVVYGSKNILRVGGENSKKTREEVARQFDIAKRRVKTAMDQKVISVEEGTERLKELARKELKLYGISAGRVDVVLAKGANGEARPHQRGAYIADGKPVGDSVPALLEKGEYVLNRNAVKKVGRHALDRLNYQHAPRFQAGGIVELLHPFNDPAGHGGSNSHLHIAMSSIQRLIALGKRLQKLGWLVSENPAFGGVGGMHAKGGYHYTGQAIDVNWPDAGAEGSKIRALLPMLQAMASGAAGGGGGDFAGLDRVQLRGPASVALEAGQGALDRIRSAANASVAAAIGPIEGVESGANFSGKWPEVMAAIAKSKGWNLADWERLVQKESGGNPTARNPSSGAFGLGQFLGATARAYAKYGALSSNGTDQIRAMAKYIEDRYGDPTRALAFHDSNNWYQAGGLVQMLAAGGPPAAPGRRDLRRVLGRVGLGKGGKATKQLLTQIKRVGLPDDLVKRLTTSSGDAATFGDMAERASALTVEGNNGVITDGRVGGKTQTEWLTDQLGALFQWRNAIIDAERVVVERREETARLIEQARARLAGIRKDIQAATERRKRLTGRLDDTRKRLTGLRKHPNRNRAQIAQFTTRAAGLRAQIAGIDAAQATRGRLRTALAEKILPALTEKRTALNTTRGDLLSNLETVQGLGSPTEPLGSLPAVGVFGGQIFDVQMRLRELGERNTRVTDPDAGRDSGREDLLKDMIREANLRTAVSQRQYDVLKDMPRPPQYGGAFATGGVVQGPPGAPRTIIAHGREGVFTPAQLEAMGGAGGRQHVDVRVFLDGRQLDAKIDTRVESGARRIARQGARILPGRAGALS